MRVNKELFKNCMTIVVALMITSGVLYATIAFVMYSTSDNPQRMCTVLKGARHCETSKTIQWRCNKYLVSCEVKWVYISENSRTSVYRETGENQQCYFHGIKNDPVRKFELFDHTSVEVDIDIRCPDKNLPMLYVACGMLTVVVVSFISIFIMFKKGWIPLPSDNFHGVLPLSVV